MFRFALYPTWEPVHRLLPYRAPLARLADFSFRPIPHLGACLQAAPIPRSTRAARRFFVSPYTPLGSLFTGCSHTALHSRGSPIFRFALYPTWEPVHRLPPYRAPLARLADFSFRPIPHLGACSQAAPIPRSTRAARRFFVSPYTPLGSLFTGCPHTALHSRGSPIFRFALYPAWEPVHKLKSFSYQCSSAVTGTEKKCTTKGLILVLITNSVPRTANGDGKNLIGTMYVWACCCFTGAG